jgi:hypothetical protein
LQLRCGELGQPVHVVVVVEHTLADLLLGHTVTLAVGGEVLLEGGD